MALVLIPLLLLFIIVLAPIPKIGNEPRIGLLVAAVAAAILGGLGPGEFVTGAVDGIDTLAWVIGLSIFGSIYAQTQIRLGTMDTVLNSFRSLFGYTPKGLVAAVILTLVLAGSLLGDAIAVATVIGVLVIMALRELEMTPEQIGTTILLGGIIGSIMPPITQAIFLSSALVDVDPGPVVTVGYITVGIGVILAIILASFFVKIKQLPEDLIPSRKVSEIVSEEWKQLVPLAILVIFVVVRALGGEELIIPGLYGLVMAVDEIFVTVFGGIPILGGIAFRVTQALIVVTIISYIFKPVREKGAESITEGLKRVSKTVQIQLAAGVMVGMFAAAGVVDRVIEITEGLGHQIVTFGGGISLAVLGMLTGSQTTAQNTIVPLMGPILTDTIGISHEAAALGASHIAAAGQTFPPVCLTAFVVVGIVGGVINEKVDPVRVMIYALPVTLYFIIVGFIAWFGFIM